MSDRELEVIRRKRLQELKRQFGKKTETETRDEKAETPRAILNRFFVDRAWEVLNAAKAQYPQAAEYVEKTLVKLISEGKLRTQISGEELYGLFLRLGYRVRLQTKISILEHGKVKSLEDKIKEETSQ
jgi:DNA-binding TFAR19-related protein (PDSD5 family)